MSSKLKKIRNNFINPNLEKDMLNKVSSKFDVETKEEIKSFIKKEVNNLRLDIIKEFELQK